MLCIITQIDDPTISLLPIRLMSTCNAFRFFIFFRDGVPYCEKDYQKLFGVRCAYCNRYISGKVLQVKKLNTKVNAYWWQSQPIFFEIQSRDLKTVIPGLRILFLGTFSSKSLYFYRKHPKLLNFSAEPLHCK
jgi:hypothetical protein